MPVRLTRLLAAFLSALLCIAPAFASGDDLVEGQDYVLIQNPRPWQPADGRIEVAEVFSYGCHYCAEFQPVLDTWVPRLPDDVRFEYVPAAFSGQRGLAAAFFAAQSLGVLDTTHAATYDALHRSRRLPSNASLAEIAWAYSQLGVDQDAFSSAANSDETRAKVDRAYDFIVNSGLQGTPTLIVNGKYRVQGRSFQETLRIAELLVARERAAID